MKISLKNLFATSLLAIFMSIVTVACKKDNASDLSGNYSIIQGHPLELKQENNVIATITVTTFDDKRCPLNAYCLANYATATLKVKDLSISAEKTIDLYIGPFVPKGEKDKQKININGSNYIIQLKEISPAAGTDILTTVQVSLSKL